MTADGVPGTPGATVACMSDTTKIIPPPQRRGPRWIDLILAAVAGGLLTLLLIGVIVNGGIPRFGGGSPSPSPSPSASASVVAVTERQVQIAPRRRRPQRRALLHGCTNDRSPHHRANCDADCHAHDCADCRADDGAADEYSRSDQNALGPAQLRNDGRELAHRVARYGDVAESEALATLKEQLAQ